jgi:excisionase family DNA binding protein
MPAPAGAAPGRSQHGPHPRTGTGSRVLIPDGSRIRELRRAAGLTQEELAGKTGFRRHHISSIENGRTPVPGCLAAVAAVFGVPVADLMMAPPPADTAEPGPAGDRFLTAGEIAGMLRVSRMTVYRLIHGRELESHRIGRSFRVRESAVRAYLRGTSGQDTEGSRHE